MTDALTRPQPTVLLHHVMEAGSHDDWLIARAGEEELWAGRVSEPSSRWAGVGEFEVLELPPHRRRYLTYEGPISGDRGSVRRVDEGTAVVHLWDADAAVLEVKMSDFQGRVRLTRVEGERWVARVE